MMLEDVYSSYNNQVFFSLKSYSMGVSIYMDYQ
jgi:hypothetical protein